MSITETTTARSRITASDVRNAIDRIRADENRADRREAAGAPPARVDRKTAMAIGREDRTSSVQVEVPDVGDPLGGHGGPPHGSQADMGVNGRAMNAKNGGGNELRGAQVCLIMENEITDIHIGCFSE